MPGVWQRRGAPQALALRDVQFAAQWGGRFPPLQLRFLFRQELRGVSPVKPMPEHAEGASHDILWAPWRLNYVARADPEDGCFLCRALASDDDAGSLLLERRERCFSILNRYPYNNGHLLVATNEHKGELAAMDDEELGDLMCLTRDAQELVRRAISPHGFNIGINLGRCAGAGVPGHLHVHIVPRWNGDTNFMPVTANTKVIVQSLEALYTLLREQIGR